MFDGDAPMSEEENVEKIKFEITRLFDELDIKTQNTELERSRSLQEHRIMQLASQLDISTEFPAQLQDELIAYYDLLDKIADDKYKKGLEQSADLSRVAVAHAKILYDLGKVEIAFDLLDNRETGAIVQAENASSWSEEHGLIHQNISLLNDLIYELSKYK